MISNLKTDAFGTHRPILIDIIKNTQGNIIELGCGNSSTKLIKELIKGSNRKLISLESNINWLNKFKHLEDENHKLFHVPAEISNTEENAQKWVDFIKNNQYINNIKFEICFIDQAPWMARTFTFNYFKDLSEYIIIHDVDYFPVKNKWGKIIKTLVNNDKRFIHEMDFSDVVKNFKVYYPPEKYFAARTGPPTLLCSNIVSNIDFNNICNKINIHKYY